MCVYICIQLNSICLVCDRMSLCKCVCVLKCVCLYVKVHVCVFWAVWIGKGEAVNRIRNKSRGKKERKKDHIVGNNGEYKVRERREIERERDGQEQGGLEI